MGSRLKVWRRKNCLLEVELPREWVHKGDGVKKGREGGDADNAGKSTTGWLGK